MNATARFSARAEQVRALAAEGMSQSLIADYLGITRERVRQICNRHGIETLSGRIDWDLRDQMRALAADGKTIGEAAAVLDRSFGAIYMAAIRAGIEFAEPRYLWHDIRDLAAEGLSLSECARKIGATAQNVWSVANAHGITFQKKPRYNATPVIIDGQRYGSILGASKALGTYPLKIYAMLRDGRAIYAGADQ